MYWLIVLSAVSASSFTISKFLLRYTTPIFLIGIRMLGAGLIFIGYYVFKYRHVMVIKKKDLLFFIKTALVSFYISFVFETWSLQYLTSSKAAFLYHLSPFVAAIFSYFFFDEKMTLKKFLGLTVGLLGFLPILMTSAPVEGIVVGYISWAEIAMFISVLFYTYGWIAIRSLIKDRHYSALVINGVGMMIGGIAGIITSYLIEIPRSNNQHWIAPWLPITELWPFLGWMFLLIILGNIICYTLYGSLLKKYTATFVTFSDFSGPMFAALYGKLLLNEDVTWHFFTSTIIVFIGVYWFYQEELRQGYLEG